MSEVSNGKVIYEGGSGELEEKKSRFIANIAPVTTEEDAVAYINAMKKKYWDARHNCSAFIIGRNQELTRCSDDGEPSGTAGRPMLDVLFTGGHPGCSGSSNPVFWWNTSGNRWTGACLSGCCTGGLKELYHH